MQTVAKMLPLHNTNAQALSVKARAQNPPINRLANAPTNNRKMLNSLSGKKGLFLSHISIRMPWPNTPNKLPSNSDCISCDEMSIVPLFVGSKLAQVRGGINTVWTVFCYCPDSIFKCFEIVFEEGGLPYHGKKESGHSCLNIMAWEEKRHSYKFRL